MSTLPASPFCHIVIPAPDLRKAKSFFERVFGWLVTENRPGPGYWFFTSGNVGGAFDSSARPAPGAVVLVLQVDDMQAALERVKSEGGTVTQQRSAIGEASSGYDAYFLCPNGNALGVYSDR